MVPNRITVLLVFGLILAGCGGCKKKEEVVDSPALFFPTSPPNYTAIAEPAQTARRLASFEKLRAAELAATLTGAGESDALLRPVIAQLGFDPRTEEGFAAVGMDGSRPLAFGTDTLGRWLLAVPVADASRFSSWVENQARLRGAGTRSERTWEGSEAAPVPSQRLVVHLGREGDVRIAHTLRSGYGLIALGPDAADVVGLAASRTADRSLHGTSLHRQMQRRLGADRDLIAWMPQDEDEGHRVGVGLSLRDDTIDLRVLVDRGVLEMALLSELNKKSGGEHVSLLSADDFFLVRLGANPTSLEPLLNAVFRGPMRQLRRAGVEPKMLLSQLHPGVVLGVDLVPEPDLSGGLPSTGALATGETNPFGILQATLVARVKDPAAAQEALKKLADAGDALRMQVARREIEGVQAIVLGYEAGETMTLGIVGDRLLAAGGSDAFARLVHRAGEPTADIGKRDPKAWAAFENGASAAFLDVPLLAEKIDAIPEAAFGIGGFRMKSLLTQWVEPLRELRGLALSVGADGDGLIVDAVLGFQVQRDPTP